MVKWWKRKEYRAVSLSELTWKRFRKDKMGMVSLGFILLVVIIALAFLVIAGVVAVTQAQRKIPVQYAKRVVGR